MGFKSGCGGAAVVIMLSAARVSAAVSGGFTGLGDLPGGTYFSNGAGIADDGLTAAGYSQSANGPEAFRWSPLSGMQPLGGLGGGPFDSRAEAISADGSTITGRGRIANSGSGASQYNAFRWTASGGMVSIGDLPGGVISAAGHAISSDGSAIVGSSSSSAGSETFRWTAAGGMQSVPAQFPASGTDNGAYGVTRDGTVLAGTSQANGFSPFQAYKWSSSGGLLALGDMPGGVTYSWGTGISNDGNVIVGYSGSANAGPNSGDYEAFRWTPGGGMAGLGDLPGGSFFSMARAVSADGNTVVGRSVTSLGFAEGFIWDSSNGMRKLSDVLAAAGIDVGTWVLTDVNAISADGQSFVGTGIDPGGATEAWIASLNHPVPEPATTSLLLGFAALSLRRQRR